MSGVQLVYTDDTLPGWRLAQYEAALADSRAHLAVLQCKHPNNSLALRVQQRIIEQHEARVATLKPKESTEWLTN